VLAALAVNDSGAFGELYARHRRAVFRYLLNYCASVEDASDLTQHVFLRAFEKLPRYEPRGLPFLAWLIRIARNAAADSFRRQRKVLPWGHVEADSFAAGPYDPEAYCERLESLNELRVLIGRLSPDKQEYLALRFAGGLTSGEIARLVGKSEAAVQRNLSRTLQWLKEQHHERDI
jgi:RNA polymerase sigma-70 factor (ECF subfamily)